MLNATRYQRVQSHNDSVHATAMQGTAMTNDNGTRSAEPAFHPGGTPSVTVVIEFVNTVVDTNPTESVTSKVTIDGGGVTIGRAEAFVKDVFSPSNAV